MANDLILDPGLLLAMGAQGIQADDLVPKMQQGQYTLLIDRFGVRYLRYMHNALASVAATVAGGLYTRAAITAIASTAAGSTATTVVTTGLTAGAHVGKLAYVKTDPTPGAAPEGEVGVITANSATVVTIDSRRPFTATVKTASAVDIFPLYEFINSAGGDLNTNVLGVALATAGITNGNWGFLQCHGYCPDVSCLSSAVITINKALIAGTAQVIVSATSAVSLIIGHAPVTGNSTNSGKILAFINLFSPVAVSA